MAHLKGQNVNLLLKSGSAYIPIAASTSCDLNIQANTEEAAAKDDPGNGLFGNPEFVNYSWSMSNESFIVEIEYLASLLDKVINGDATFDVQYQIGASADNEVITKKGSAIVSSLSVDASNGSFAKVTLSLEGNGELTSGTYTVIANPTTIASRIKGKALMLAVKDGANWKTFACATSHKLTVNIGLSDVTDKDYNDKSVLKEITDKSVSLTTDNLIDNIGKTAPSHGAKLSYLYNAITSGTTLEMQFGYYPDSIGQSVHTSEAQTQYGYAAPDKVLVSGKFICTNLSQNGSNKEDATFSAEFTNKGAVTVSED